MQTITMKITIDEAAHTVALRRVGCKLDESKTWSDSPAAIAATWRDLAEYAMREAFYLEHTNDFVLPSFTNAERVKMAARVCEEHKSIFEPSADCA